MIIEHVYDLQVLVKDMDPHNRLYLEFKFNPTVRELAQMTDGDTLHLNLQIAHSETASGHVTLKLGRAL